jgi:hypothetical protein
MQPLERGLRRVSPERRRQIAHLGGVAAQRAGTAHRWTTEEASAAARVAVANRLARLDRSSAAPEQGKQPNRDDTSTREPVSDNWVLVGRDGRQLQCQTQMIGAGFEVSVGYPGTPLMYSDIYPDIASARRLVAAWREAALASGNFGPVAAPADADATHD